MAAIVSAVRNMFLFKGLGMPQLELLARTALSMNAKAGEIVISQGSEGEYLYIVQDGKLDVFVKTPGTEPDVVDRFGRHVHEYEGSSDSDQHPYFGELALQYKGA